MKKNLFSFLCAIALVATFASCSKSSNEIVVEPKIVTVVESFYPMDGTKHSFVVHANIPFTVVVKSNQGSIISDLSTSGAPNTSTVGTPVSFKVTIGYVSASAVVTLKSPTGLFPDIDVTLKCVPVKPKSNSYMLAPNTSILIPVDRCNESELGVQLSTVEPFTSELVWTDHANKIADNSAISMIKAIGNGSGGYILVSSGSASGNAVVCIKNSSNNILWSWHIWITSYIPTPIGTGQFMDRNLGATNNATTTDVSDVHSTGLFYQWGRKDPFPGTSTLNGIGELPIYNASGSVNVAKIESTVASNFANSVANPLTFYWKNSKNYDWYGTTQNNLLWGPASKTVYDPCPDGWRVPQYGAWGTSDLYMGSNGTSWTNYGILWSNYGSFYPASGLREAINGSHRNVGSYGYYWSATVNGTSAYFMGFDNINVSPNYYTYRAFGFNVRCVKEYEITCLRHSIHLIY